MPRSYSVADARAHLPDILDEVEAGKEVELTRRGRPVAVVVSAETYQTLRGGRASFADAYRSFLQRHSHQEMDLERNYFGSLRDKTRGRRVRL